MQQRALLFLALFIAPAVASSASASSQAAVWLHSYKSPTEDQLKELAGSNPAAYAIVNALLAKHSQGGVKLAPEERGPDVFRNMMTPSHLAKPRAHLPYGEAELAEVRTPIVDQAHYDPNAAADRDESSVSRLLSAVASMAGKKGKKIQALLIKRRHSSQEENPLTADASLFVEESPKPVVAPVPDVATEVLQAQAKRMAKHEKHENSYLKGIDLTGDMPAVQGKHAARNVGLDETSSSLTSFSFGDDAPAAAPKPKPVIAAAPKNNNAFLKYFR